MTKTRLYPAVIAAAFLCFTPWAESANWDERVTEELARGQLYDGEKFVRLVALGPDAVEPLCSHLESYKFPSVILAVFAELGDVVATLPVVSFLENREHEWAENDVELALAIATLRELNDPRAEPILKRIADAAWADVSVRFAAVTALVRTARSERLKTWARDEVLDIYYNGRFHVNTAGRTLTPEEVYPALCEVDMPEVHAEVKRVLTNPKRPGYHKRPMLETLGRREYVLASPLLLETLREVAQTAVEEDVPDYTTRMYALEALCRLHAPVPKAELVEALDQLKETSLYETKSFRRHFIVIERFIEQETSQPGVQS